MQVGMEQTAGRLGGKTRYVFAASHELDSDEEREQEQGTKVCPRCGQLLFKDMDVCYGCLYDFSRDAKRARMGQHGWRDEPTQESGSVPRPVHDPLASIELDEIDDEQQPESPANAPRHRREDVTSTEDTIDLATHEEAPSDELPGQTQVAGIAPLRMGVWVSTPEARIWVEVPERGLVVGRDLGCDLVLRSREVSRRHLQLVPQGMSLVARDLGATNPATIKGLPLVGEKELGLGDMVSVCGTEFVVAVRGREGVPDGEDS